MNKTTYSKVNSIKAKHFVGSGGFQRILGEDFTFQHEYEAKMANWNEKLESMRVTFDTEKAKIEKAAEDQMTELKDNLDATLAEKGEL